MYQSVKCLPCKTEDLSSILRTHQKNKNKNKSQDMMGHNWDPWTTKVETGEQLGHPANHPSLLCS